MSRFRFLALPALLVATAAGLSAQTFPSPDYFRHVWGRTQEIAAPAKPQGFEDFIVEGKLRLGLANAIRLMLANNTDVAIESLGYEQSQFAIDRAYAKFDPGITTGFSSRRSTSPTTSTLQGAPVLSDLSQQADLGFSQTFQTGTQLELSFSANKASTNSTYATFNPSIFSSLTLSFTQPLLRNRGFFPNRAPIQIAQRNREKSRADFAAAVNQAIADTVDRYWAVVRDRESLKVRRKSLELAQATYEQNKRALELGALPPLDIYRSEAQVASRKLLVIQAEYQMKQSEDLLRQVIGADLDDSYRALEIELVEEPQPAEPLIEVEEEETWKRALELRPELDSLRRELASSDLGIRAAHEGLQPDLSLTGFYTTNGRGGNRLDAGVDPPLLIAPGGLGDALGQLKSFDFPTYGFSLQLSLPLRNHAVEADLASALVAKRRVQHTIRQRRQSIRLEVRRAVQQLEQANLSMEASKTSLELARQNLDAEQRKYELGAQTIFFVLDAQTQLAQAELDEVEAQILYQRAVTAVDRVTGETLEKYHVQIAEP